jgi:4-amino-4-deoxychorismate lyase
MLPASTPDFELFTSLRYDPRLLTAPWNYWPVNPPAQVFLLLHYHLDRLVEAARRFEWPAALKTLSHNQDKALAVELLRNLCQDCVNCGDGSQQPLRVSLPTVKWDMLN